MTTYGDLVGQAAADLRSGFLQFLRYGFTSPDHARNVIGAYYDTLDALRAHTWALVDPQHVRTHLLVHQADTDGDIDRSAVGLFASIQAINPRRVENPYPDFDFTHPWLDASRRLGAAGDLLATHHGPHLTPLSEYARIVLDDARRRSALGTVAQLTEVQLATQQPLGLRAIQAGVPWADLQQWLPGIQEPIRRARHLHHLAESTTPGHGLWDIPLNDHTVRVGNPIDELADRLGRLRHAAWALAATPEHAMGTLRDLAGLGVAVHAHAAVLHGLDLAVRTGVNARSTEHQADDRSNEVGATNWILTGGRAWQRVCADLQQYLTPAVPDPAIREDITEVRQLLNDLIPLHQPLRLTGFNDAITRRYAALVNGAVHSMARVAEWNATTFAAMAASGAVQVRVADLTGDQITDDPALVTAKLRLPPTARVSAPPATTGNTAALYRSVGQAATRIPTLATVRQHEPVVEYSRPLGRTALH
ncbi:hypothetical protein [Cellulomonas sp. URHD0024]|uniref:hypothetical protein n=1 Tax=Cellulomonas sp. URHD0024 TaxID=1302620 RepID=UPI0003FA7538|nr:hypothetical protein [Cellulomonas sp. URHD0024]